MVLGLLSTIITTLSNLILELGNIKALQKSETLSKIQKNIKDRATTTAHFLLLTPP